MILCPEKLRSTFYLVKNLQNMFSWKTIFLYHLLKFVQFNNFWKQIELFSAESPFSLRSFSLRPHCMFLFQSFPLVARHIVQVPKDCHVTWPQFCVKHMSQYTRAMAVWLETASSKSWPPTSLEAVATARSHHDHSPPLRDCSFTEFRDFLICLKMAY